MPYIIILFFTLLTLNSVGQTEKKYNKSDESALYQMAEKWERYWNMHNMDSMATLLRNDIDFVTVSGTWLKSKEEAVAHHKRTHTTVVFKTSIWTTDSVAIKYVKPDLAILHVKWGIKGDFDPDGTPRNPRHGVFTWVVTKQEYAWLLLAVHNVNVRETTAK